MRSGGEMADELEALIAEKDRRIAELETALRELLDTFNPEPRMDDVGLIWGRAAKALKAER